MCISEKFIKSFIFDIMKLRFKTLLLAGFSCMVLAGCSSTDISDSSNVKQEEIWQKLSAVFNEETGKAEIMAQFRFGGSTGTTLRLTEPSNITVNGQPMTGGDEMFMGQVYRATFNKHDGQYLFVFQNTERKFYENMITMNPLGFQDPPTKINGRGNTVFVYNGLPIHNNESVELRIDGGANGSASISASDAGVLSVTVTPDHLKNMKDGPVKVRWARLQARELEKGTHLGGVMSTEFISLPVDAVLMGSIAQPANVN